MKSIIKLGGASLFTLLATSSFAIPFDTTTVGGTVKIGGENADYEKLYQAAEAFNSLGAPYIQGNWKVEIQVENLEEPQNVGFGNTVPSGSSLVIKPAAGVQSKITFTQSVDNSGPTGHLLFGIKTALAWTDITPTQNITLDGSNNGTDSRDLTIENNAVTFTYSSPLVLVGPVENVIIKNVNITNVATATGSGTSGITAITRYNDPNFLTPISFKIINNHVRVGAAQGHGIHFRQSPTATTGAPAIGNFEIRDNLIEARIRGVFLDAGINGTIENNDVRVGTIANVAGYNALGIAVNNSRSGLQTLNVLRNKIFMKSNNSTSGAYGSSAFSLATGGTGNTVNFNNNMINFQFTAAATPNPMYYVGFRATSAITYNIFHNSFNMPNFENLTGLSPTAAGFAAAIKLPTASTVSYTANIKKNIFRVDQAGAAVIVCSTDGTKNINSENNVIFRSKDNSPTAVSGTVSSPETYLTIEDWRTHSGQDLFSVVVDPYTTTGSKWEPAEGTADLHFVPGTTLPAEIAKVARLEEVLVDIDNTTRNVNTLPGADDIVGSSNVSSWMLY